MAWNYINGTGANAASNLATTAGITTGWTVVAGNLLLVSASCYQKTSANISVSDNVNSTNYGYVGGEQGATGRYCHLFSYVPPVGGTFTVTVTSSAGGTPTLTLSVMEFSYTGGATFSVDNAQVIANEYNSTTATLSGNLTPTGSDLVVFAVNLQGKTGTLESTPVTFGGVITAAGNSCYGNGFEYVLNYSSPINPTMGISPSGNAGCIGACFKAVPTISPNVPSAIFFSM